MIFKRSERPVLKNYDHANTAHSGSDKGSADAVKRNTGTGWTYVVDRSFIFTRRKPMQAITKYKANDGCEFKTEAEAIERDKLVAAVDEVMAPLNPAPKVRDHEYAQHDPAIVIACRVAVLKLCAIEFPTFDIFRHKPPEEVHPRSVAGRILDDCGGPLKSAWYRFMVIDDQGREWEQPYYVANPPMDAKSMTA